MTHRAAGTSRGVPRIWLLPIVVLTGILGLIAGGLLSRSLILDLVAWWPVWALSLIAVVLAGHRRIGKVRVAGLVPMLVTGVLVAFVVAHIGGWPLNPSASRYLVGPPASAYPQAELAASIQGELRVSGGSEFVYEVDPVAGGGDIAIPMAEERTIEDAISVQLEQAPDPGFDRFAGWRITLSSGPLWTLDLGGTLSADLTGLRVKQLDVAGAGTVKLGATDSAIPVEVEGAFSVGVPVGVPVTVMGTAQVPSSWEQTSDGWRSPVGGVGWVISVPQGSIVSIEER